MNKRVFVSSTSKDLARFREAVQKVIRQLKAIDISMEHFGARDERPKEECLHLITDETDIFIGIYAYRYGHVPEGEDISITEAEYDAATAVGISRLIYLVDEAALWVPSNIDSGLPGDKLHKFKDKLKANHICEYFSSQDDLAAKVAADLGRCFSDREARVQHRKEVKTVDKEIRRYLDQHAARSHHTARTYRNALKRFTAFLEEREIDLEGPVTQLTIALARDFITWLAAQRYRRHGADQQLSMRSRSLYAQSVSGLYRMLVLEGNLDMTYGEYMALHEHMVRATNYTIPPIEKKLPPDEVVDAVLAAALAPPDLEGLNNRKQRRLRLIWLRNRAMMLCLYSTGMRVGELVGLRRGDLDYDDKGAWVSGKGDKERFVRFSNQAWGALIAYLEARHDEWVATKVTNFPLFCRHDRSAGDHRRLALSSLTVERLITDLANDAGVLERFNLTPHSFRHWFATRFLRHTRNLALTQDVMGHASPQTTRIYAKTTKEDHIAAHESLFDDRGKSDDE